jgi:hypothetical protein
MYGQKMIRNCLSTISSNLKRNVPITASFLNYVVALNLSLKDNLKH